MRMTQTELLSWLDGAIAAHEAYEARENAALCSQHGQAHADIVYLRALRPLLEARANEERK